jgi:hypothetical protein
LSLFAVQDHENFKGYSFSYTNEFVFRSDIVAGPSSNVTYGMRDLYHRQQRLACWIKRVNTDLEETDRVDVLKLVEHMQDRERAVLWIIRCVTALLLFSLLP